MSTLAAPAFGFRKKSCRRVTVKRKDHRRFCLGRCRWKTNERLALYAAWHAKREEVRGWEASGLDAAGMRQLSDTLLARIKSGVVVIGRSNDGKASLIVRTSDDLTKKVPAGQVIKELAPIIGGKGGGKADMAEGGGNQPEKLAEALEASYGVIERMLGS